MSRSKLELQTFCLGGTVKRQNFHEKSGRQKKHWNILGTDRPVIPKRARGDGKQRQKKQVARSAGVHSEQLSWVDRVFSVSKQMMDLIRQAKCISLSEEQHRSGFLMKSDRKVVCEEKTELWVISSSRSIPCTPTWGCVIVRFLQNRNNLSEICSGVCDHHTKNSCASCSRVWCPNISVSFTSQRFDRADIQPNIIHRGGCRSGLPCFGGHSIDQLRRVCISSYSAFGGLTAGSERWKSQREIQYEKSIVFESLKVSIPKR